MNEVPRLAPQPDKDPAAALSESKPDSVEAQSDQDRENALAWLEYNTWEKKVLCDARCDVHEPKVRRWSIAATTIAWAAAFLAALGGVSIIADQLVVASVLAISTAALTTFLATVKPADMAANHKTASASFRDLSWQFGVLDTDVSKLRGYVSWTTFDPQSGQYYDAGYYKAKAFSADVLDGLDKRFRELGDKYVGAVKSSPSIALNESAALKKASSGSTY